MSQDFVHLHVHSDYSMLDGACQTSRLCQKVAELGQKAVALTDHGNMFGAFDLYEAGHEYGIKTILGCEFYMTPSGIENREDATRYHLVLLAKNYAGYQTLCRLNRIAWTDEGYYYKPRIDRKTLEAYHQDLICLSACVAGEIPTHILNGNEAQTRKSLEFFLELFGHEDFYLELQYHGKPGMAPSDARNRDQRDLLEMELRVNRKLAELGREYDLGLVCTNDAHYLEETDYEGHDALLCIGTQTQLADEKRLRFSGDQFYVKSGEEMAEIFAEFPEAVTNTLRIAERCNIEMPQKANHYPVYRLEDRSDDPDDPHCPVRRNQLRTICIEGLPARYNLLEAENPDYVPGPGEPGAEERAMIMDRMNFELDIIDKMGYISYFLVVWDFIKYARDHGIPVGPGRGSGAGSLVAYLSGITDLDPLRYNLLFERFLNPDRVSPPDFDIDFCERRRGEVIEYVRKKYGAGSVAQIGTFGTLKAKAVLKDVARVMGVPFADANRVVGLIPTDPKMTLKKALDIPEARELYDREGWVREMFTKGGVLEGLNRNQSIHACGVIIGDEPLENVVPLARGAGKEWITQFPAHPCEELGLLKMDFLGLKTLTIIADTIEMVNARTGESFTPNDIPLDDARTFELLNRGATVGVFQLESGGMQDLCRSFGISRLEEIIALVALYRPGPMEFIPTFINCKLGRETPEYETPEMKRLLSETYGIMVYQEQIMQVVQAVAGLSLAQADIMRRAIGKKKESVLIEQGEVFKEGCLNQGHSADIADSIWQKILKFASYGFNKSHSACYALMSYRTAYLKANYPAEFMAAVLNGELGNAEKMAFYIAESRRMGLEILPPDVNGSQLRFGVADGVIRFGLGAIKGVGSGAAEAIIHSRQTDGPFSGILDFCERCGENVNRRVMENLCKAGAFDSFGLRRSQVFGMIESALAAAQRSLQDRRMGQGLLFDLLGETEQNPLEISAPDIPEWDDKELLSYEKELLGFYVTGHPIDQYASVIETFQIDDLASMSQLEDGMGTRVGGIVTTVDIKRSKRDNRPWAIVTLENRESEVECMVFADAYQQYGDRLVPEMPVLVEGNMTRRDGDEQAKLSVERVIDLKEAPERLAAEIHIRITERKTDRQTLQRIHDICAEYPGDTLLIICAICEGGELAFVQSNKLKVLNTAEFREALTRLLGDDALHQKADRTRPSAKERRRFSRRGEDAA